MVGITEIGKHIANSIHSPGMNQQGGEHNRSNYLHRFCLGKWECPRQPSVVSQPILELSVSAAGNCGSNSPGGERIEDLRSDPGSQTRTK